MWVLALAAVAGAGAAAAWLADRQRFRQRNERGECGACALPWAEKHPVDPYLVQGRLVCQDCAGKARRRLLWHFGSLAAAAALATGFIAVSEGIVALLFVPAGATAIMTIGAVGTMKRSNREAQRRIAAGEFPEFHALLRDATATPPRTAELSGSDGQTREDSGSADGA